MAELFAPGGKGDGHPLLLMHIMPQRNWTLTAIIIIQKSDIQLLGIFWREIGKTKIQSDLAGKVSIHFVVAILN